ncbi:hypothetical protein AA309_20130 [Microvirga vignae]|uniref:Uncharacterized protein n=1 Tax=Microvirga vignae TaxID=1225564 RepID=A0A0H1R8G7_9HYPH|nr:hypothetical protein AA309_20130 [Microvirga vignae]
MGASKFHKSTPEQQVVRLNPVTGDTEENKAFFQATPGGSIELQVVKPGLFELGKEYYVDFTPADA